MTLPSRRLNRSLYARTPDNSMRVNSPDGFLHDFMPVPWSAGDDAAGQPGGWWLGSDSPAYPDGYGPAGPGYGPRAGTTGSPLTKPDQPAAWQGPSDWLPAVTRCLTVITEAVIRTRWLYHNSKGEVIDRPRWVHDPMLLGGSPGVVSSLSPIGRRLDRHTFWSTILADAILWGQGGLVFVEDSDAQPLAGSLQLLNPFMFEVRTDGRIVLDRFSEDPLVTDFDGRFTLGGVTWRVAVMHGQYPSHEGWPAGVLLKHFSTFRLGARIARYMDGFYTSGIPSGYLSVSTPNFGEEVPDPDRPGQLVGEQDLLKRRWMAAHGKGRRSVAVLNSTVTYTPISVNPVDADIVAMASVNRVDVAHSFGLDGIWVGEGASGMSYSNSSERRADLVALTAAGWGEKMTQLVSSLMPYGSEAGVNWSTFISTSFDAAVPSLVAAVNAGIMTASEARQQVGLTPWTGPSPEWQDVSPAAVTDGRSATDGDSQNSPE